MNEVLVMLTKMLTKKSMIDRDMAFVVDKTYRSFVRRITFSDRSKYYESMVKKLAYFL